MTGTRTLLGACGLCLCIWGAPARADEVVVFAASSLQTALDALAEVFEADTGHRVTISYGGSGQLARQIMAGAPADLFVSASVPWMDAVEEAGLLVPGSRRDLFGNALVLIGPQGSPPLVLEPGFDLLARLQGGKLAMALVEAVPAGQYGKAALQALGVWEAVQPHVAQADNVRAALAFVARGEAPLGIVYASDAAAQRDVAVLGTFPATSHPPIVFPGALLTGAADAGDRAFLQAITASRGDAIFAAQGFVILN